MSADARESAFHVHVTIRQRDRSGAGAREACAPAAALAPTSDDSGI